MYIHIYTYTYISSSLAGRCSRGIVVIPYAGAYSQRAGVGELCLFPLVSSAGVTCLFVCCLPAYTRG